MDTTATGQAFGPIIEQIVENVFQTMMGLEVERCDAPWPPPGPILTASVSLTGSWKGAVLVEYPLAEALFFTSRLISIPIPEELTDDVRDAVGELGNMIGGNLKSILPGGVELSLPSVVWGSDYRVGICRACRAQRWVFGGERMTFAVVLVEVTPG